MKTPDKTQILNVVFAAVDEVNLQLRRAQRLDKVADTVISGEGSKLDSLGLVNLIFALEQKIEQEFGVALPLADDVASAGDQNPFRTLGSLADYVHSRLEKKLNG
ncbi:MAG: acyl carrier protein [Limisphaerales bacterium]